MNKNIISKIKFLYNNFKNPLTVGLFNQRIINKCALKFKDSRIRDFEVSDDNWWVYSVLLSDCFYFDYFSDKMINSINSINENNETFNFGGIICKNDPTSEVFFEPDDYKGKFSFKNRVIIDIGGNVADTALKFANYGGEIYAFEAMPSLCEIAKENISFNPTLKDKIHFYNKAVSAKPGKLTIYENSGFTIHSQYDTENGIPHEIEAITIDYILNDLNVKPDVLKIDCEGCEYPIVLESDLSMFKDIILEYHAFITKKPYNLLVDKLEEQGFIVNVYGNIFGPLEDIGIIHAHKD